MREDQVMEIRTLGSFSISAGGKSVTGASPRSGKVWTLFKYLISNRSASIPTEKLIETLWPDNDIDKPINALFTLVYRLRGVLDSQFKSKQNFILFHHDCYIWNKHSPYILDSEQFEQYCAALEDKTEDAETLIQKGLKAVELYGGEYLPELQEEWAAPIRYHYKKMYTSLIINLTQLYFGIEDYAPAIKLCEKAIELEPYEETYHIALIDALLRLGQTVQAMAQYDFITYLLQKDLGAKPSDALLALRKKMYNRSDTKRGADQIKASFSEAGELLPGAFYCDIDAFRHIYRLASRTSQRSDGISFLVEMSIESAGADDETLTQAITLLRRTALFALRRNDIITQYSQTQLLLLLDSRTEENCGEAVERISARFLAENKGRPQCAITHSIAAV